MEISKTVADHSGFTLWALEIGHEKFSPSLNSGIIGLFFLQLR